MPNVDSSDYTRFKKLKALHNDQDPNIVDSRKFRGPQTGGAGRVPIIFALNEFLPGPNTQHSVAGAVQYGPIKKGIAR